MKYYTEPQRRIPIIETDVLVAGAGTAGLIAAIAAARSHAKVLLIEKLPVPGGTLTNGGIGFNCYFSQIGEKNPPSRRIVGGLAFELAQRLEQTGCSTGFVEVSRDHYRMPYRFMADHEALKAVASQMLEESQVTVLLQTYLSGVVCKNGAIEASIIENKDGRQAVVAKQYIDATGDGDIARKAGVEQFDLWQDYDKVCGGPTGLVFSMAGINFEKALRENYGSFLEMSGSVPADSLHLGMQRYSLVHSCNPRYPLLNSLPINYFTSFQSIHPGEATYINNSAAVKIDATDAEAYSKAEMTMRSRIFKMGDAFRKEVPGFENSYINWASIQLGVRASKITACDFMLSQPDITGAVRFSDEIGLFGFHDFAPKNSKLFSAAPGFYGMPYRMLIAKGIDNLQMAGRCVTSDLYAHMSTRNTVCCMIMGQAAGIAAALCAQRNCNTRELSYSSLRSALLESGVILE